MDRYQKEVLQVSTRKHGINVQYLYDKTLAADVRTGIANEYVRLYAPHFVLVPTFECILMSSKTFKVCLIDNYVKIDV